MSLLISSYLNGQLWKKYNEDKANKAAAEILELEKLTNQHTASSFVAILMKLLKKTVCCMDLTGKGSRAMKRVIWWKVKGSN